MQPCTSRQHLAVSGTPDGHGPLSVGHVRCHDTSTAPARNTTCPPRPPLHRGEPQAAQEGAEALPQGSCWRA
eukprot:10703639-Alexandrium_andersonii.AAC.1